MAIHDYRAERHLAAGDREFRQPKSKLHEVSVLLLLRPTNCHAHLSSPSVINNAPRRPLNDKLVDGAAMRRSISRNKL
jgi:hypothetical protein